MYFFIFSLLAISMAYEPVYAQSCEQHRADLIRQFSDTTCSSNAGCQSGQGWKYCQHYSSVTITPWDATNDKVACTMSWTSEQWDAVNNPPTYPPIYDSGTSEFYMGLSPCNKEPLTSPLRPPAGGSSGGGSPGQCSLKGSVVFAESQLLTEEIQIVGAPFALAYHSGYQSGHSNDFKIEYVIAGDTPRDYIQTFAVENKRNGIVIDSANYVNNAPNQTYTYIWNGLDPSNSNPVLSAKFNLRITETSPSGSWPVDYELILGHWNVMELGLGGWSPTIIRRYDTLGKRLYRGDGGFDVVESKPYGTTELYVADPNGQTVYIFDSNGRHLHTKNAFLGSAIYSFNYDSQGRLSSISQPFSRTTVFNRNSSGTLTSITAHNGQVTTISLNGNGYISQVTNPQSESHLLTYYGSSGLMQTFEKPNGEVSTFEYDSNGLLTKDSHSGGYFFELVKNLNSTHTFDIAMSTSMGRVNQIQTTTSPDGSVSRTSTASSGVSSSVSFTPGSGNYTRNESFDGISRYITSVDDQRFGTMVKFPQSITATTYSSRTIDRTQAVTLSDPTNPFSISSWTETEELRGQNTKITTVFDPLTKKFTSSTFLGEVVELSIDAHERTTAFKHGSMNQVQFNYTNEHLTSVVQGTRTTSLGYHSTTGNLQSITNPLSQTTSFVYDNANRVTSKILPDARAIGFGYDANGNVTSVTPPNRPAHYFSVNGHELVGSYAPPALSGVSVVNTLYSYNLDKQLTQVTRPDGAVIDFNYNATTGVLENFVTPAGTYTLTMDYSNGLPSSIVTADGYQTQISYAGRAMIGSTVYDSAWGLIGIYTPTFSNMLVQSDSVTGADWNASQVSYLYDDDENLTGAGDLTLSYNIPNGQLTGTSITAGTNVITDTYTYNNYGEVTGYEAKLGTTTIYSLSLPRDASGRINGKTQAMSGTSDVFDYTFDLAGRLTETKKNTVTVATYGYDSNSNRNSGTIGSQPTSATYDDQDRLITYNTLSFTYNANGDLQTKTNNTLGQTTQYVYDVFGNLTQVTLPNTTLITYEIDGLNRRVGRKINGVLDKRWIYMDQYRIAAETDASGAITKRFVYGSKGNIPDYMISGGENYRIISDHLGSPRLVIKISDGTIVHQMNHDEFGRVTQDTNPGYLPFGFAGGLYDVQTGLVRFGARDYDAEVGRWTSKDPILFNGGDSNLFGYVANDPVNWIDPSGLKVFYFHFNFSWGAARNIGSKQGSFNSVSLGVGFDTDSFSPFFYTVGGKGNSGIGAFGGASFGGGYYEGNKCEFAGAGTSTSSAAGYGFFGGGFSINQSSGKKGYGFDIYGPGLGFTANRQNTQTYLIGQ